MIFAYSGHKYILIVRPDENLHHPLCRTDLVYPPQKIMCIFQISRLLEAVYVKANGIAIFKQSHCGPVLS